MKSSNKNRPILNLPPMKNALITLIILIGSITSGFAQVSCDEIKDYVKSKSYGSTFYSSGSEAINKVSFHEVTDDSYKTYYFAIVQFTSSYKEYIYQVDSRTKWNYSMNYSTSAGQAFWEYIQPYNSVLGCAPDIR